MSASTPTLRWGILGTGAIARSFAADLRSAPGHAVEAVGSRSASTAADFAEKFSCRPHASYESLCADPGVDIIYVATPHNFHHAHALLAIAHGKPVLVEKPFTVNAAQAREIIAAARSAGVFCMEAMWTRFLPATRQVLTWIAEGAIGEVRQISADFGFRTPFNPQSRLFSPALAGGALLDVGIYTVSYAFAIAGRPPDTIAAATSLGPTGVDDNTALLLSWTDGPLATLTCSLRTQTRNHAVISGTAGRIEVPWFWRAESATLYREGLEAQTAELPPLGKGFIHEAIEVARCLRAGLPESPLLPLDETLAIIECLDESRRQIGLRYPDEVEGWIGADRRRSAVGSLQRSEANDE